MSPEEVHCGHPHEAVPLIIQRLDFENLRPCLVRIEGTMLAGKSSLAAPLAMALGALRVAADCYDPFGSEFGLERYRDALRNALLTQKWVVTDSVCLSEIAPEEQFGRGYCVYIRRLELILGTRGWRYGFDIDDEEHSPLFEDTLERMIILYHRRYRPHETADLIVNVPDEERGYRRP